MSLLQECSAVARLRMYNSLNVTVPSHVQQRDESQSSSRQAFFKHRLPALNDILGSQDTSTLNSRTVGHCKFFLDPRHFQLIIKERNCFSTRLLPQDTFSTIWIGGEVHGNPTPSCHAIIRNSMKLGDCLL